MARSNREFGCYTDGSTAYRIDAEPERPAPIRPKPRRRQKRMLIIHVDFLALVGILIAAALLILMVAAFWHLEKTNQRIDQAQQYIEELRTEHDSLERTYQAGYDLDEIRQQAIDQGLIPASQAQHLPLQGDR